MRALLALVLLIGCVDPVPSSRTYPRWTARDAAIAWRDCAGVRAFVRKSGKQGIGQVPMELAKPNAAGVIEQSSQLPLGNFPAGTYGLRITISQGTEKVVREAGFTVVE